MTQGLDFRGDDSAYLHFRRESSCEGNIFYLNVEVDGKDFARLRKGHDRSVRVAPGEHRVKIHAGSSRAIKPNVMTIDAAPQENIDVIMRCDREPGLFGKLTIHASLKPWRGLVRSDSRVPPGKAVDWSKYRIDIDDSGLTTEPAGQTVYVEDNRLSDAASTRKLLVENEWVRTIMLGGETAQTRGFTAGIGVGWVTVTAKAENSVTSRYSLQQGERTKVTHEVEVNVPARTRVTVFVHWKLVWHHGVVKMSGPAGSADVPFRFVHSLDYDRYTVSG